MKTKLLVTAVLFFFAVNCFADSNVYATKRVYCSRAGDVSSCEFEGSVPPFFKDSVNEQGIVNKGFYTFKQIITNYQTKQQSMTFITYINHDSGFDKMIQFSINQSRNVQAYHDGSDKWAIVGYQAMCSDGTEPSACPLGVANQ